MRIRKYVLRVALRVSEVDANDGVSGGDGMHDGGRLPSFRCDIVGCFQSFKVLAVCELVA